MTKTKSSVIYDVGLSFSGVNRETAEKLNIALKQKGVSTFLDSDFKPRLAGEELTEILPGIYKEEFFHCLPIVSDSYVVSVWAKLEKRAALNRAMTEDGYLIPIRLDDTEVPGISGSLGYLDARQNSIDEIADVIATKIMHKRTGMEPSDSRKVSEFDNTTIALSNSLSGKVCPLGQAHLIVACEKIYSELFARMHTAWIYNQSDDKYEALQPFPAQEGMALITEYSSSWPSYDLQLTFIDNNLNVYVHHDLPAGFNLLDSNLPTEVKGLLTLWKDEQEDEFEDEDEEINRPQFFVWSDNLTSSRFNNTRSQRVNIGTIFPHIESGSGSGPRYPEVFVFGEIHVYA